MIDEVTQDLGRWFNRDRHNRPPAVAFVPTARDIEKADRCEEHCRDRYDLLGTVTGDWRAVEKMRQDGVVDIIVVDELSDLPPDRIPRVEVVAYFQQPEAEPHHRTARLTRRDAAE